MKPCVSLTFDDGLDCQFYTAVRVLNKRDLKGTFFLPVAAAEYPLNVNMWSRAADADHEIGCHSMTHIKAAEYRHDIKRRNREIAESKEVLQTTFNKEIKSFCYPYTDAFPELQETVKLAQYRQARGGRAATSSASKLFNGNYFNVPCYHVGPGTVHLAGEWAKEVRQARGWLTLMFHGVGGTNGEWDNISEAQFNFVLDAMLHETVAVKTFDEAAQLARNPKA